MVRIWLILLAAATGGCVEYNIHPTRTEADALTEITRLTGGFEKAGQARWTRDLQWIAFRAVPVGERDHQIYLARTVLKQTSSGPVVAGINRPIRVTPAGSRNGGVAFSPDGLTLILASTGAKGDKLRLFEADGWAAFIAGTDSSRGVDLTTLPIPAALGTDPDISPDGKHVVFVRDGVIWSMRLDGSDAKQLTKGPDFGPKFSPDGKRLVFARDPGNKATQIYVADLADDASAIKNERPVTRDLNSNVDADWHPDGNHIVYATSLNGRSNYDLYVMAGDGHGKTRVTFYDGADLFPQFSPDGKTVQWTSRRTTDGTTQVYVARFTFPRGS